MIAHPEVLLQPVHQREDLRLRGHVERGRRLVGDQQVGVVDEGHGDHHALAHAAGELVRIVVDAPFRARDADRLQQLERARRAPACFVTSWCSRTASLSCRPIVCTGFSDVIGSWKIIAMSLPRISRSRLGLAVSSSSSRNFAEPLVIVDARLFEAHDREAGDALAGAGLADDAERLALLDARS